MKHLTKSKIQAFLKRDLPPQQLLELDDHLRDCPACRAALEGKAQAGALVIDLQAQFAADETHLQYEQLSMLAEGKPVSPEVERHAIACSSCAAELEDFRQFVAQLAATPRTPAAPRAPVYPPPVARARIDRWRSRPIWYGVAAAVLLAAVGGVCWQATLHVSPAQDPEAGIDEGNAPKSPTSSTNAPAQPAVTAGESAPDKVPSLTDSDLSKLADMTLPPFSTKTLRGQEEPHFEAGMKAYASLDCRTAAIALTEVPAQDERAVAARLYTGVCQMHDGDLASAAQSLRGVANAGDSPQQEAALYYLAQIDLLGNNVTGARDYLAQAIKLHGEFEARARSELDVIR